VSANVREEMMGYSMPDPMRPAHQLQAQIPFAIAAVLARALALDRERRYATANEMRQALQRARQDIAAALLEEQGDRQEAERALAEQRRLEEEERQRQLAEQRKRDEAEAERQLAEQRQRDAERQRQEQQRALEKRQSEEAAHQLAERQRQDKARRQ